ncbi:MAG: protein kinase domain-containing protein, partial [Thermoguttaceae bacterium]
GQKDGLFYIVMEYVDGVNLRQAMRTQKFSPEQALVVVPQICEALQYAHEEGVLHRDIKPENILLDKKGRVKIADFGLGRLSVPSDYSSLTQTGSTLGTPFYMSPEQLEQPNKVDHRTDIYSLGVVFYELLTGELPLGRFAPPSDKSPVNSKIDDVVFKALEKERERRQQSAAELKSEVETATSSQLQPEPESPKVEMPEVPETQGRSGTDIILNIIRYFLVVYFVIIVAALIQTKLGPAEAAIAVGVLALIVFMVTGKKSAKKTRSVDNATKRGVKSSCNGKKPSKTLANLGLLTLILGVLFLCASAMVQEGIVRPRIGYLVNQRASLKEHLMLQANNNHNQKQKELEDKFSQADNLPESERAEFLRNCDTEQRQQHEIMNSEMEAIHREETPQQISLRNQFEKEMNKSPMIITVEVLIILGCVGMVLGPIISWFHLLRISRGKEKIGFWLAFVPVAVFIVSIVWGGSLILFVVPYPGAVTWTSGNLIGLGATVFLVVTTYRWAACKKSETKRAGDVAFANSGQGIGVPPNGTTSKPYNYNSVWGCGLIAIGLILFSVFIYLLCAKEMSQSGARYVIIFLIGSLAVFLTATWLGWHHLRYIHKTGDTRGWLLGMIIAFVCPSFLLWFTLWITLLTVFTEPFLGTNFHSIAQFCGGAVGTVIAFVIILAVVRVTYNWLFPKPPSPARLAWRSLIMLICGAFLIAAGCTLIDAHFAFLRALSDDINATSERFDKEIAMLEERIIQESKRLEYNKDQNIRWSIESNLSNCKNALTQIIPNKENALKQLEWQCHACDTGYGIAVIMSFGTGGILIVVAIISSWIHLIRIRKTSEKPGLVPAMIVALLPTPLIWTIPPLCICVPFTVTVWGKPDSTTMLVQHILVSSTFLIGSILGFVLVYKVLKMGYIWYFIDSQSAESPDKMSRPV